MITKDKNKSRPKTKSKVLVLGLMLLVIITVGVFSSTPQARAQTEKKYCFENGFYKGTPESECAGKGGVMLTTAEANAARVSSTQRDPSKKFCFNARGVSTSATTDAECLTPPGNGNVWRTAGEQAGATAPSDETRTEFDQYIEDQGCGLKFWSDGCILKLFYLIFYRLPSFILYLGALFFNSLVSMGINSELTSKSLFIPAAWAVVRDLSNIFFILILLYVAIKTILGLAGHDGKKMIATVILMALLINFSMFFTKVIIDSSNILALIFYNKVDVQTSVNKVNRPYDPVNKNGSDKDISGGMYKNFDPTTALNEGFFKKARTITVAGVSQENDRVPLSTMIGIILVAAAIMLFASYCFFVAGLSFLGRLVELWVLIIFSPFAFMSFTIPLLGKVEYLGWDAWLKRLLATAFMAPIFMFFIYLIFILIKKGQIFGDLVNNTGFMQTLLGLAIPALIILMLLYHATKFAKKGGGVIGGALITGAKIVGGLAVGVATGGAALLGTQSLGRIGMGVANSDDRRRRAAEGLDAAGNKISKFAQMRAQTALSMGNYVGKKSYDVRQTGIGKFAESKSGIKFADKGLGVLGTKTFKEGRKGQIERLKDKGEEKVKTTLLTGAGAIKQDGLAAASNLRAEQYKKDLEEAKTKGTVFNETSERKFKEFYEQGKDLRAFKLDKQVEGGGVERVGNAQDVNNDRREAYAISLEKGGVLKQAMRGLFSGMGKMVPVGAGAVGVGALTGVAGVGAGVAGAMILGGGVIQALKDGFNKLDHTTSEVAASIRKGPSETKELVKELKKLREEDTAGFEKVAKKISGGGDHGGTSSHPPTGSSAK